eukprot:TRINITY_DN78443_c0_g1_i1.p1 TRINITY_DN78443_c0_g1~~TRINITY_DN78443_c0_g1_i1.p1  ORF type:complete len:200 (-),score=15.49 TRINITY_DN78443_c0_g1_i1:131-730(-)
MTKGYGFVTFATAEQAKKSVIQPAFIQGLKTDCHQVISKNDLKVQLSQEADRKIFIGGLTQNAQETMLREYFRSFGPIEHVRVLRDCSNGRSRGFAYILFKTVQDCKAAQNETHHYIDGKLVEVKGFCKNEGLKNGQGYKKTTGLRSKKSKKKRSASDITSSKSLDSLSDQEELSCDSETSKLSQMLQSGSSEKGKLQP